MPQIKDGPHFMFDPAEPLEDGVRYAHFANVSTSEIDPLTRIVSDGQRVHVLDDLLRRGFVFVPVVAMSAERIEAVRYAAKLLASEPASGREHHLAALEEILAEIG